MRKIKEHLQRPITAAEASGAVPLVGDALRRHARLEDVREHPYARLVREHREAKTK